MNNRRNLTLYRAWAPIYDAVMRPLVGRARQRTIGLLKLQPHEHVLISGVGTGLDLPFLPDDVHITAVDLSPDMLARARAKAAQRSMTFTVMDAQALDFPDRQFDAVILNLILSVVPDGARAFREAWRVVKPSGRIVIFDKFLPEAARLTPLRAGLGKLIAAVGTDPNRRLSEIIGCPPDLKLTHNEPSLLGGQYRIIRLDKDLS